ncbi:UNVERIFIED_CONTAM: protein STRICTOSIDINE SYNTHASE-LIKE 3 [Sesamum calycinum]|uniref:Protein STRICTOSIDINE SYNTHASE-LIKE 3 n=1 Tax=Sesamum calycinum TaxID=2727403 RepID=A0AAW2SGB0_9LAMI
MKPVGIFAGICLLLAVYCAVDPLNHSAVSEFPNFETFKVEMPAWSEIPVERDRENLLQKSEIKFLNQVQGPESVAFDPAGRGPYTGVADGRVVFWDGENWTDFAYTSANRSGLCDPKPSPVSYLKNEHICGRPLGLRFEKEPEFYAVLFSGEDSGRLLKYDPYTKETTVLVRNLQFPNGVSLSKDGSFFVFCEGSIGRLRKYWLKGEKAGTSEVMAVLPGYPDNIRTNKKGEFWVAIHCRRSIYSHLSGLHPKVRKLLLKLPIPAKFHFLMQTGGRAHGIIVKYSPEGKLVTVLEDRQGKVVKAVSEVEEKDGELWIGSVLMPFLAVYKLD